jgi:hypothetical protein
MRVEGDVNDAFQRYTARTADCRHAQSACGNRNAHVDGDREHFATGDFAISSSTTRSNKRVTPFAVDPATFRHQLSQKPI